MTDVVLFGLGQLAEVAKFYLDHLSSHRVVAVTANRQYLDKETFDGVPVVAWEELEQHFPPNRASLFIPVGYNRVNEERKRLFLEGRSRGYKYISFVHPNCTYYGTPIGENCFIFEDNTIQPFTTIGDNVIMWSGNHIGHHSCIGDHCFITSHVVVSGAVTVGERTFIGVNATVRDNVTIGAACVIGAGALVLSDQADQTVLPAKATVPSPVPSSRLTRL